MVQDITIVLLITSFNFFLLQKNLPISQIVYQLFHYTDNCFLIFENSYWKFVASITHVNYCREYYRLFPWILKEFILFIFQIKYIEMFRENLSINYHLILKFTERLLVILLFVSELLYFGKYYYSF